MSKTSNRIIVGDPFFRDPVTGVISAGRVFVYSLQTAGAQLLYSHTGATATDIFVGRTVTNELGNLDGDFRAEFGYYSLDAQMPFGGFVIIDGSTMNTVRRIVSTTPQGTVTSLERLGDLPSQTNGVSRPVIAAMGSDGARIFDYITNTTIATHPGAYVRAAEDVDGDGDAEYLRMIPSSTVYPGGALSLMDGATHTPLWTIGGSTLGDGFASDVDLLADMTSDGLKEIAIGVPGNGSGPESYVLIVSQASGTQIARIDSPNAAAPSGVRFGASIASAGDVDGDGMDDLVIGSPNATSVDDELFVFRGEHIGPEIGSPFCSCTGFAPFVAPCGNSTTTFPGGCLNSAGTSASLRGFGNAADPRSLFLRAEGMPASTLSVLFAGIETEPLPVTGSTNGLLCVKLTGARNAQPMANAAGEATYGPDLRLPPAMSGQSLYFQSIYRDIGGPCGNSLNWTSALSIQVQ